MRSLKIAILCSMAAAVLAGATADGASASTPAWYVCAKAVNSGSGDYTAKTCTEASKVASGGKYELREGLGKGKAFKGKGGGAALEAKTLTGTEKVDCASTKSLGTPALPALESGVTITFKKCRTLGGEACSSSGKSGEIVISGLEGSLYVIRESPLSVGIKLESEAHPGPEGLLVAFSCEGLEASIKGSLDAVQTEDINAVSKSFEDAFSGALETTLASKGEALMLSTTPVEEGGGGGSGVLIGEDESPGHGGDSVAGEVTPVLFTAKAKGTIEELKFEEAYAPSPRWCHTVELGVVAAKTESLSPYLFGSGGKKTTYGYTPGPLIEAHSVACGTTEGATLSVPGFHVPIEAGVHYFLTFLPLGPDGDHFDGSRISYKDGGTESVLFEGQFSGGKEVEVNTQKKNAIEESPGLANYEWWLEKKEAPISIWAVGTKH